MQLFSCFSQADSGEAGESSWYRSFLHN